MYKYNAMPWDKYNVTSQLVVTLSCCIKTMYLTTCTL